MQSRKQSRRRPGNEANTYQEKQKRRQQRNLSQAPPPVSPGSREQCASDYWRLLEITRDYWRLTGVCQACGNQYPPPTHKAKQAPH